MCNAPVYVQGDLQSILKSNNKSDTRTDSRESTAKHTDRRSSLSLSLCLLSLACATVRSSLEFLKAELLCRSGHPALITFPMYHPLHDARHCNRQSMMLNHCHPNMCSPRSCASRNAPCRLRNDCTQSKHTRSVCSHTVQCGNVRALYGAIPMYPYRTLTPLQIFPSFAATD